jgi:hypothetical protein
MSHVSRIHTELLHDDHQLMVDAHSRMGDGPSQLLDRAICRAG